MTDDTTPATKADLTALKGELQQEIAASAEDVKRHFDVVAEKMSHDVLGALKDCTSLIRDMREDYEPRIRRLERFAGFAGKV